MRIEEVCELVARLWNESGGPPMIKGVAPVPGCQTMVVLSIRWPKPPELPIPFSFKPDSPTLGLDLKQAVENTVGYLAVEFCRIRWDRPEKLTSIRWLPETREIEVKIGESPRAIKSRFGLGDWNPNRSFKSGGRARKTPQVETSRTEPTRSPNRVKSSRFRKHAARAFNWNQRVAPFEVAGQWAHRNLRRILFRLATGSDALKVVKNR